MRGTQSKASWVHRALDWVPSMIGLACWSTLKDRKKLEFAVHHFAVSNFAFEDTAYETSTLNLAALYPSLACVATGALNTNVDMGLYITAKTSFHLSPPYT